MSFPKTPIFDLALLRYLAHLEIISSKGRTGHLLALHTMTPSMTRYRLRIEPFSLTHVCGRTRCMWSSNSAIRKPMLGTPLVIRVPVAKVARTPTISDQSSMDECSGQAEDHRRYGCM